MNKLCTVVRLPNCSLAYTITALVGSWMNKLNVHFFKTDSSSSEIVLSEYWITYWNIRIVRSFENNRIAKMYSQRTRFFFITHIYVHSPCFLIDIMYFDGVNLTRGVNVTSFSDLIAQTTGCKKITNKKKTKHTWTNHNKVMRHWCHR